MLFHPLYLNLSRIFQCSCEDAYSLLLNRVLNHWNTGLHILQYEQQPTFSYKGAYKVFC